MRSVIAVVAGFAIFWVLFSVLARVLGGLIGSAAAGVLAGYFAARLADSREMMHGAVTAGLAAAYLAGAPQSLAVRAVLIVAAAVAITAGAWIRSQARTLGSQS